MSMFLKIVGIVWLALGLGNIIGMPWSDFEQQNGLLAFGLIFNMVLFVIPGLVVYALGAIIKKKQ
jgi:hypothetical protein